MGSLIMKVIKKERIANIDMENELWEICERVHSCCINECPIYEYVLTDNEKADSSCIYFKNGEKMLAVLEDLCCKEKEKERKKNEGYKRYFVDKRIGCVAVRDEKNTDMDNPCLQGDTKGVVKFWIGSINKDCDATWTEGEKEVEAAKELDKELNKSKE